VRLKGCAEAEGRTQRATDGRITAMRLKAARRATDGKNGTVWLTAARRG
jgi:hypothetical protein